MKNFKLKIITPNIIKEIEEVTLVNLSTIAGEITILPNHYPLISSFDATKVVYEINKSKKLAFASDGLINVKEHEVVFVCSAFELKNEIDLTRAKNSLERALININSKDENIDINRAKLAKKKAEIRINIVEEA